MTDREKVIKWLECCGDYDDDLNHVGCTEKCPYYANSLSCDPVAPFQDALKLLKGQESIKRKMWNALYAEEDKLEKQYAGTDKNDDWFFVYRPWLQRGFEIALETVVKQEGR